MYNPTLPYPDGNGLSLPKAPIRQTTLGAVWMGMATSSSPFPEESIRRAWDRHLPEPGAALSMPPVGAVLFAVRGAAGLSLHRLGRAVWPAIFVALVVLVLVTYIIWLNTFLANSY